MPRLEMSVFAGIGRQYMSSEVINNFQMQTRLENPSEFSPGLALQIPQDLDGTLIPGLPDEVAKLCVARVPRTDLPAMGAVSKNLRSFIQSKEFLEVRKEVGKLEEWVCILTGDAEGRENHHWEILNSSGEERKVLPIMPGPAKAGFGVVAFDFKLFIVAGYVRDSRTKYVSKEVFQYDARLNRWSTLANLNFARRDFACAEVAGKIYAAGGFGENGDSLSSVEVYDPDEDKWTCVESLRHPRWGCFGCSYEDKLYVMGRRSVFSIGSSRCIDVYSTNCNSWCKMKNGCVMVTAHAVLGNKLLCLEWKNDRNLVILNMTDNSLRNVPIPVTGSSAISFRFGTLDGKLLLFAHEKVAGYKTLVYDPEAAAGSEWQTSLLNASGLCYCSLTIQT